MQAGCQGTLKHGGTQGQPRGAKMLSARPHLLTQSPYHESLWAQSAPAKTAHELGVAQGPGVAPSGLLLLNQGQGHTGGQGQGFGGGGRSWPWMNPGGAGGRDAMLPACKVLCSEE